MVFKSLVLRLTSSNCLGGGMLSKTSWGGGGGRGGGVSLLALYPWSCCWYWVGAWRWYWLTWPVVDCKSANKASVKQGTRPLVNLNYW